MEEAKTRFKSGMQLYQEGSLDGALAELRRAYELAPNWKVLYNIGAICRDQRDYVEAIKAYERFLADGGKFVEPGKKKDVEKDLETLRKFVATVEIMSATEGVEVRIDDEVVGKTPFAAPISVNAGKHKLTGTMAGRNDAHESVTIAGGDALKIELNPLAPPKAGLPPAPPTVTTSTSTSTGLPVLPIALLGLGGAALATGGVFGFMTLSARSDAKAGCTNGAAGHLCSTDARSSLDKEQTFALVTDIAVVSGVVLAGVGVFTLLRSSGNARAASSGMTAVGRARVGGFEIAGTF